MTRSRRPFVALGLLLACESIVGSGDAGGSGTGGSSGAVEATSTGTTASTSTGTASTTSAGTSPDTTATTSTDDASDGPSCVLHHHETGSLGECDSDGGCCPGEKCVPSPRYSSCVPLDPMPAAVGEPCMRQGYEDDCVAGAVCRGVDPATGEGRCIEFCALGHGCDANGLACFHYPDPLCLRACDPVFGPVCDFTDTCLPNTYEELFGCLPDERIGEPGLAGDPCVPDDTTFAGCDSSHVCVPDEAISIASCAGDLDDGCCTPLCTLTDPVACTGVGAETCEPFATLLGADWAENMYGVGYCR